MKKILVVLLAAGLLAGCQNDKQTMGTLLGGAAGAWAGSTIGHGGGRVVAGAAASRYIAEDALELITVEYETLEANVDARKAADGGAPLIHEDKGTNTMFQRVFTWGEVDAAFSAADRVVSESYHWHRLGANPLETFGCISQWDPLDHSLTCWGSFQSQYHFGLGRAAVLGIPTNKVRIISQPHGGSFGGKGGFRGPDITALLSRKAGGRPVKWIEDRMEYLSGGAGQAWDRHYDLSLALKSDGTIAGLEVKLLDADSRSMLNKSVGGQARAKRMPGASPGDTSPLLLVFNLFGARFDHPGSYTVTVELDGEPSGQIPLKLRQRTQTGPVPDPQNPDPQG